MRLRLLRIVVLLSLLCPGGVFAAGVRFNAPVTIENTVNYFNDAGATDSYAGSLVGEGFQGGAYIQGTCVSFSANTANTGAATLSLNGITPAAIKKMMNGLAVDLVNGDICPDQHVRVCFEQTYWQMVSPVCNEPGSSLDFSQLTGTASDAQIPDLNVLSTSLTTGRCVEVDGAGKLGVAAGACGVSGGSTGISGATLHAPLYALGGTTATSTAALTNGQLLIGATGNPPIPGSLGGTANQIRVTLGAGTITLDFPPAGVMLPGTTALATPLALASGGTGTGTTLTGLVRGSAVAMTAAELSGDVTTSGSNTTTIAANAVTLSKLDDLPTDRLLGRDTPGMGDPEAISVGGGLEFTGTGGLQRAAMTGDVTAPAGSSTTTIANNVVTYAKLQEVSATDRLLGRDSAGAGVVEELSPPTVKSMLALDQVNNTPDAAKTVATAVALAANGANCVAAGTFPIGVDALGAAENCTALVADPGSVGLVNRTSPTASAPITSTTVGQVLRVTGSNAYAFGALDLADADAVTNDLPYSHLTPATAATRLLGRGAAGGAGDWQEVTLGSTLTMSGTVLDTTGLVPTTRTLTIDGTANQIVSSAGSQDLSTNRLWTLSLPQNIHPAATPQFGSLGLGEAPLATAGTIETTAGANNVTLLRLKRNTDTTPTGNFVELHSAAGTSLWTVDITGSLSVGSIPLPRVSGTLAQLNTAITDANLVPETRTLTAGFGIQTLGDLSTNLTVAMDAASADDQVYISDSTSDGTWRSLPNCTDSGGNHLNYTAATNSFSCGTSSAAAGGAPGGSDTFAQYRLNSTTFGGSAGATYDADAQLTQRDKCTTLTTSFTFGTHLCVYVDTSAGPVTATLPNAAMTNNAADVYYVYKVSNDANQLILAPNAGDNLQFSPASMATTVQGEGFRVVEQDGAATGNWLVERAQTLVTLAQGGTGQAFSDPGGHRLWGWDETDNQIRFMTLGSGLSYDPATDTISAAGGAGGTRVALRPYSAIPVTGGMVYGCIIDGDEMLCVTTATLLTSDAIWRLGFEMPPALETGCTYKLQLDMKANATTGVIRINPKWNTWAPGVTRTSLTLNAETVTPDNVTGAAGAGDTVTLGAGDSHQLIRIKWTLNAATVTAGQRLAMDLTFEDASTTLAVESGYLPSIICE